MRIGLLGGTFNPIHNGHLQIAEEVLYWLKLDRVLFIPTGKSPQKKDREIASKGHRLKMISLVIKGHFTLCDIEIKSARVSYTIDTISALKRLHPKDSFFFIIGTDAFSKLSEWKEPERLLALCPFVIVPRIGFPFSRLPKLSAIKEINRAALGALTQKERRSYTFSKKGKMKLFFIRIPPMRVSASEIRTRIKDKKSVDTLLPKTVLSYIMSKGLYTKAGDRN